MEYNQNLNIGNKISTLRKEKCMTQVELAEKLFVSHQAISQWENATTLPDINSLLKICEIFNVTMNDLFDMVSETKSNINIPNDDVLRILAVKNGVVLKSVDELDNGKVEIIFNSVINGNVSSMFSLNCSNIFGNVAANSYINCNDIEGDVAVGGQVNCNDINGDVAVGNSVSCNDVSGNVKAGRKIECGDIVGDIRIGESGTLECEQIIGNVIYEK